MKYIKLFEAFNNINEGAISVFTAADPFKEEGSIQWTGVVKHTGIWKQAAETFTLTMDIDYDFYTANPEFRSKSLGTWKDSSLSKFTDKFPRYREVEFDLVEVVENEDKPNEPWLKVVDKKGVFFLAPPHKVIDIQKGASVVDDISSGSKYLIKEMKAIISDYKKGTATLVRRGKQYVPCSPVEYGDGVVFLKYQDGSTSEMPIAEWKKRKFTKIDDPYDMPDNSKREDLD